MQIVLDTYGLGLSVRNGCFLISLNAEKRLVHPSRVSSFLVTMPCRLSSPAIVLAARHKIAIIICTKAGKAEARLWQTKFPNTSSLRRKQYGFTRSESGFEWVKEIILTKISHQVANLNYLSNRKPSILNEVEKGTGAIEKITKQAKYLTFSEPECLQKLRYFEAAVARIYWPLVGSKLPGDFFFRERVKRKPADPFNSCINYLYGMLRNQAESGILSAGLDPALACMHRDGYNLSSMVFDLMEPFRPVTDKFLIEAVIAGELKNVTEITDDGCCLLDKTGRKKIITLFNGKLDKTIVYKKTRASFKNHIILEIKNLVTKIISYDG